MLLLAAFDRKIGIGRNLYDAAVLNLLLTHNTLTQISHFILGSFQIFCAHITFY